METDEQTTTSPADQDEGFAALGSITPSSAPSRRSATKSRRRSSARRFRRCSRGTTCSGRPRPAPARPPRSRLPMLHRLGADAATSAASPRPGPRADARARDAGRRGDPQVRPRLGVSVLPIYGGAVDGSRSARSSAASMSSSPRRAARSTTSGRETLQLDALQIVVLDEADEMLDMGFADDLEAILAATPDERQTALFSATLPPRILAIAEAAPARPGPREDRAARTTAAGEAPRVRAGRLHRAARAQAGGARARARHGGAAVDDRVLPHAHRGRRADRNAQRARLLRPKRCTAGMTQEQRDRVHAALPRRRGRHARRDRRRRARPRHRAPLARRQLRRAVVAGRVRAPHRPHRPRRTRRRRDHAGRAARAPPAAEHRAVHQAEDHDRVGCRPSPTCARAGSN